MNFTPTTGVIAAVLAVLAFLVLNAIGSHPDVWLVIGGSVLAGAILTPRNT